LKWKVTETEPGFKGRYCYRSNEASDLKNGVEGKSPVISLRLEISLKLIPELANIKAELKD
jgi:hypothetical protein